MGQALDTLNALTLFAVAHAASEVSTAAANATAAAGSQDYVADLNERGFPLLAAAARTSAGTDDSARFEFARRRFHPRPPARRKGREHYVECSSVAFMHTGDGAMMRT